MHPIGMANLVFRLGLDGNTPHVKRIYFGSHDNSMFGRGASSPGRGNVDGSIPGSPPGPPPGPRFNDAKSSTKFIEGAPPYAAPGAIGYPPIDACGAIPGPDPIDIGGGAPAPTGAAGIGDIGGGTSCRSIAISTCLRSRQRRHWCIRTTSCSSFTLGW